MTVLLDGKGLVSGMSKEIILKEVVHDNGRVINNGPRELGTNKKDKIGVQHKDQLPLDSSHRLDPNQHRDQLQTGNNRLLVSSHNSLLGEVHLIKDTSSHSIHFTEGECSDTCANVHSVDI